jgi:hypothetical protein
MELSTIIPNTSDINWIVKGDFLMYRKYSNIPIAYTEGDTVFIFLDLKVIKVVSRLIKHLVKNNIEFYFDSPEFSNPAADVNEYNTKVVTHYLFSHANKNVFAEFKRINFDLIKNMVSFCDNNNCHDILKPCYERVKKDVLRNELNYYSGKTEHDYPKEIREEFENLYRDIQISRII